MWKRARGLVWLIRRFGLATTVCYERDRRTGTIDYAKTCSPDELAKLGEYFAPAPWEGSPSS